MTTIKPFFAIADAVIDALAPPRQHALPPEVIAERVARVRDDAAKRRAAVDRLMGNRDRYAQVTEDDIVALVVSRLRKRTAASCNGAARARRRSAA